MSIFERASRLKLEFETVRGPCGVDDLWDLPLTSTTGRPNLDVIAIHYHRQLKNDANVSFVDVDRMSDGIVQLKFDIVIHIINVRKEENKKVLEEKDRAAKKQRILEIMADKQDESLKGKSLEELQQMVAGM